MAYKAMVLNELRARILAISSFQLDLIPRLETRLRALNLNHI